MRKTLIMAGLLLLCSSLSGCILFGWFPTVTHSYKPSCPPGTVEYNVWNGSYLETHCRTVRRQYRPSTRYYYKSQPRQYKHRHFPRRVHRHNRYCRH